MLTRNTIATLILGLAAVLPTSAQEIGYRSSAAVQYFGSFQSGTNDNGVTHDSSNSGGVLATYRFYFNRYHGVETNYGYTRNTQHYALGGDRSDLPVNAHEVTAAYVLRRPGRTWTPFALAGAGALVFAPDNSGLDAQARATFVYGVGADVNFSDRWFLRAQYRGLVFNSPVIGVSTVASERLTHQAQPSIGLGWRF